MSTKRPPVPLSIAGSDPTGGAGLQADMKVFLQFGLSGASVVTAATVQSPTGVVATNPLPAKIVKAQLETLLKDVRPAVVKVGMLGSADIVRVAARLLGPLVRRRIPIVIDPVFAASDGTRLLPRDAVQLFKRHLVPLATLLTPNVAEAAELAGCDEAYVRSQTDEVIQTLLKAGARNVLIKGGHVTSDEATDVLGTRAELILYSLPRVPSRKRVHGTGCALAAAIAALLARGETLDQAVQTSKEYVHAAIAGAQHMGRGARMLDFLPTVSDA